MTHTLKCILALLLLVGCQHEPIELDDNRPNPDGSIGFRLQIEGSGTDSDSKTKGTPHDDLGKYSTVQLKVYAHTADYEAIANQKDFFRDIELEQEASNWKYTPPMFWPVGKKLSFVAYASDIAFAQAGISFLPRSGEPVPDTIQYNVPTEVIDQPDLLVSAKFNEQEANNVSLTMKHALSCVSFVGVAPEAGIYVKSITLRNVYSEGRVALKNASIEWIVNPDSIGVTVYEAGVNDKQELEENPPANNNNYLMTADGYLMMIPQRLENPAIDVLYWNGKDDAGNQVITYLLPTDDESYNTWKPGMKYIYRFGSQSEEDITVVYYEKYANASYGLYYYEKRELQNTLDDTKVIQEAGYGVMSKESIGSAKIRLGTATAATVTAGTEVKVAGSFLYPVNQTGNENSKFALTASTNPLNVYVNDSDIPCGMIVPHFAKGVYMVNTRITDHTIRTPQQIRNISALTGTSDIAADNPSSNQTFKQELNLDFSASASTIGGGTLSNAIVDDIFFGTYQGQSKSISNITISASGVDYVGLFSQSTGILNHIVLKSASITGKDYVGGIVGYSREKGAIYRPQIIGSQHNPITISGNTHVGGIAGWNRSTITGNTDKEEATEITVAEVSGWVTIQGAGTRVGGIAGYNDYGGSINTVLVNGVYVKGPGLGNLDQSLITIKGTENVGGIVGQNDVVVNGNITGSGDEITNMPDVAGIVAIYGTDWVGGIAGSNAATGTLNSVNIRLGRMPAMIIKGTGSNIGGIVGVNYGKLGTVSKNTFISVRGNIEISGVESVGGIVGKNTGVAILENCFVYDFYSQGNDPKTYYAPKIAATYRYAGGLAGSNEASLIDCSVFSASNAKLIITAPTDVGGIIGFNQSVNTPNKTEYCSVIGRVEVEATTKNAGGFFGGNTKDTETVNCWIGSSDGYGILKKAKEKLGLVMSAPGIDPAFGIPYITGKEYIGGIVGLNSGLIKNITLSDNVRIGKPYTNAEPGFLHGSNNVGGIAGGNTVGDGTTSVISGCTVENKEGKKVVIKGSLNIGGVVGLNNGLVDNCEVKAPTENDRLLINVMGSVGGIVGLNGSRFSMPNSEGNDHTIVQNCKVTGYVTIKGHDGGWGTATNVGGIVGINGSNENTIDNVFNCVVRGEADANSILISVGNNAGGIVGTNDGNIRSCDIQNATIKTLGKYAGGIAGQTTINSTGFNPPNYRSDINNCKVHANVTITGEYYNFVGALVGWINSTLTTTVGTSENLVNNSAVLVKDKQPTTDNYIVGESTGEGGIGDKTTILHRVTVVPNLE